MTAVPALRLLTETLTADQRGVSTGSQFRQLVLDGAGVVALRKQLGNDAYDVLETLFLLAAPTPSGVVVYNGANRISEILGWSRQKASRVISTLSDSGFLERTQETGSDETGRPRFGRGVIRLDPTAVVTPDSLTAVEDEPPPGGLWGSLLSPEACRQVLTAWGVSDAQRLVSGTDQKLLSDAIKFVSFELRSGTPINNPGGYLRTVLRRKQVPAPGPHVPQDYLTSELTPADVLDADPNQARRTLKHARAVADGRRARLENLFQSLPEDVREEITMEVDELMRAYALRSDTVQRVRYFEIMEAALAERGLLADVEDVSGGETTPSGSRIDPPF